MNIRILKISSKFMIVRMLCSIVIHHIIQRKNIVPFSDSDHERLKNSLSNIKGCFVLSYNDDEYIRELYKDFNIMAVERQNNLSSGLYKELIITNY